jgi:hypothetical protein
MVEVGLGELAPVEIPRSEREPQVIVRQKAWRITGVRWRKVRSFFVGAL